MCGEAGCLLATIFTPHSPYCVERPPESGNSLSPALSTPLPKGGPQHLLNKRLNCTAFHMGKQVQAGRGTRPCPQPEREEPGPDPKTPTPSPVSPIYYLVCAMSPKALLACGVFLLSNCWWVRSSFGTKNQSHRLLLGSLPKSSSGAYVAFWVCVPAVNVASSASDEPQVSRPHHRNSLRKSDGEQQPESEATGQTPC